MQGVQRALEVLEAGKFMLKKKASELEEENKNEKVCEEGRREKGKKNRG